MEKTISIIVPCYNEEAALPYFLRKVREVASLMQPNTLRWEFIFVNDGSRDGTLNILREAAKEGYDIAGARRTDRKGEPPIRSFFARLFYRIINRISNAQFVDGASDFRMFSRPAVDALLRMGEYNRFSKGIFGWIGFQTKWIPYENVERVAGETKWSFWKLFKYSLQGIIAFSTVPLAIASLMGILFCGVSFLWLLWIFIKTLIWGDPVAGFPTLACLLLFIGGSIQLSLGILGQYLAKTYLETKHRPIYLVSETEKAVRDE